MSSPDDLRRGATYNSSAQPTKSPNNAKEQSRFNSGVCAALSLCVYEQMSKNQTEPFKEEQAGIWPQRDDGSGQGWVVRCKAYVPEH